MSLALNLHPDTFSFGSQEPELAGDYIIGEPYFAIYGKFEKIDDEAPAKGKGDDKKKTPKTHACFPVTSVENGDEVTCRYAVGYSDRCQPGVDAETPAAGVGNDGPRGPFLLRVREDTGERWAQNNEYDTFAKFWGTLVEAGVPKELLASASEKGLGVLKGIGITFASKVEEYVDKEGKTQKRKPFNFAVKGSYKAAKGATKPKATTTATAKAANGSAGAAAPAPAASDVDSVATSTFEAMVNAVVEKLAAGEEVNRADVARLSEEHLKASGLAAAQRLPINQGLRGTGRYAEAFNAKLAEAGVNVAADGSFSA